MVFKPINLARSVLSKTFPNGYAASLVAASQSSSASHNTHFSNFSHVAQYFGKSGPSTSSHASHNASHTTITGVGSKSDASSTNDRGLDAYYAAWQKHHRVEDKEWHQFQFAKRIGWKAPTTIPDPIITGENKAESKVESRASEITELSSRPVIQRAQSDSALVGKSDDAIDRAVPDAHDLSRTRVGEQNFLDAQVDTSKGGLVDTDNLDNIRSETPKSSKSDQFTQQLAYLAENQRHAEIPAVFEAMLQHGIKPSPTAYNALLLAAINLPKGKHQVVPKVLDVYSDMLRRRVSPDTATYAILIEVLAARASDVKVMKQDLEQRRNRHIPSGVADEFLFASDRAEYNILAEDDSLRLAIRLFDTSAAVTASHKFPSETYRLLISACAEQGRIGDMVRIYGHMESQGMLPPTAIFAPMIEAFALTGDLKSSVECYEEYKSLAMDHDAGLNAIDRRDADIYAALVRAYALCNDMAGGLKFLAKIEDNLQSSTQLNAIRDAVAVQALVPNWVSAQSYTQAMAHVEQHVSTPSRSPALQVICIDAADKNDISHASEAFDLLVSLGTAHAVIGASAALMAAHLRNSDIEAARGLWNRTKHITSTIDRTDLATLYAQTLIRTGAESVGLAETRQMFIDIRSGLSSAESQQDVSDRIDEAIQLIAKSIFQGAPSLSASTSVELLRMMFENGSISNALAEHLLLPLGPAEISTQPGAIQDMLFQIQAGLISQKLEIDVSHVARFAHLLDILAESGNFGALNDHNASLLVEKALAVIQRPALSAKWQSLKYQVSESMPSPSQYKMAFSPTASAISPIYEDSFDPYAASTDFKGSTVIAEQLEKSSGRHAAHLSEALLRFKNMRRVGRHPRYITYAKLIAAAAKENRLSLAQDILAMARQDVPLVPNSRVVFQGWVSILDAMVGACLTIGNRSSAAQYHQELLSMGAAPSANTFGLYITTLKESTKVFDEATEAVKIFMRAKTEGVEPTSFLYNALIGKLGKARRIDDCLFYFAEMRSLGIRPTSITYGTIVNALCRVSDDRFAEELFEEMESMPNYKPRPAPYNSLMQYFLTTKRDRSKVLLYYNRMRENKIEPTMHTYKLLIDTHATLEPIDMPAAEAVLADIRRSGAEPEAVHYASLIHAKGCVMHDLAGARETFSSVMTRGRIAPQASLYQALLESMVANHDVTSTEEIVQQMSANGVALTPYIANTLIHGWALAGNVSRARAVFDSLGKEKREPSTYEAMTRAYLSCEDHTSAVAVVREALARGYPSAVANKICDLIGGSTSA